MSNYISKKEFDDNVSKDPNFKTEKIVISNDSFAICENIGALMSEVRRLASK